MSSFYWRKLRTLYWKVNFPHLARSLGHTHASHECVHVERRESRIVCLATHRLRMPCLMTLIVYGEVRNHNHWHTQNLSIFLLFSSSKHKTRAFIPCHVRTSTYLYSNPLQTGTLTQQNGIYLNSRSQHCVNVMDINKKTPWKLSIFPVIWLPFINGNTNLICLMSFLGFVFVLWNVTFGRELFVDGIYFNELRLMKLWLGAWENKKWIVKRCWFQYAIHTTSKTLMATLRKCCTLPISNAARIGRVK